MSLHYDMELHVSLDRIVYSLHKRVLRSDDYEVLSLYSGDESAAIEGLRTYVGRKGEYFDPQRKRMMPKAEFLMQGEHGVVDLIFRDGKKEKILREKFIERRKRREIR